MALLSEIDLMIFHQLNDNDLYHRCLTNQYSYNLCIRDKFLLSRIIHFKNQYNKTIHNRICRYTNFHESEFLPDYEESDKYENYMYVGDKEMPLRPYYDEIEDYE